MKKLNVQKDLDSRARIETTKINKLISHPTIELEKDKEYAKSENSKECENHESYSIQEKKVKGRRPPSGNTEKIQL